MCTGMEALALASLATTAGGGVMQYRANEQRADATNDAAMAEALRQDKIDQDKMQNFSEALKLAERDQQQANLDAAAAERTEDIGANVGLGRQETSYQSPASSGAPRVVQEYADRKQGEADDFVSMLGGARGRLGAWNEGMMDFSQGLGDLAWQQNELNRQAGQSAQIGSLEAQLAGMNTGNKTALAGNLMAGLGQAGLGYSASNGALSRFSSPELVSSTPVKPMQSSFMARNPNAGVSDLFGGTNFYG